MTDTQPPWRAGGCEGVWGGRGRGAWGLADGGGWVRGRKRRDGGARGEFERWMGGGAEGGSGVRGGWLAGEGPWSAIDTSTNGHGGLGQCRGRGRAGPLQMRMRMMRMRIPGGANSSSRAYAHVRRGHPTVDCLYHVTVGPFHTYTARERRAAAIDTCTKHICVSPRVLAPASRLDRCCAHQRAELWPIAVTAIYSSTRCTWMCRGRTDCSDVPGGPQKWAGHLAGLGCRCRSAGVDVVMFHAWRACRVAVLHGKGRMSPAKDRNQNKHQPSWVELCYFAFLSPCSHFAVFLCCSRSRGELQEKVQTY